MFHFAYVLVVLSYAFDLRARCIRRKQESASTVKVELNHSKMNQSKTSGCKDDILDARKGKREVMLRHAKEHGYTLCDAGHGEYVSLPKSCAKVETWTGALIFDPSARFVDSNTLKSCENLERSSSERHYGTVSARVFDFLNMCLLYLRLCP
eukprot:TRINITY_DN51630_c0_g1_i1.p1 TRINITY_DN51630_c0_g1~~TRINITY_DN51630_c0_g1_i1.p1  ORF type:complete len:152 (-),score=7.91 TRINITY_DN51630_c0_g1_i1:31-486(-)